MGRLVLRQSCLVCRGLPLLLLLIGLVSSTWAQEEIRSVPYGRSIAPEHIPPTGTLRLTLKANPDRLTAGAKVRFDVAFSPDIPGASIVYSLWINGTEIAQWRDRSSYIHRFDEPGTFEALVIAKIVLRSRITHELRSNGVRVSVSPSPTGPQDEAVYQRPRAKILPETLTLTQGQEARFQARHTADPRLKVSTRWDGPAGLSRNPDMYVVPTRALAPGTYTIHYWIRDSKNQEAEAQAELQVVAVDYERPRAHILPETLTLTQGEEAHFQARSSTDHRLKIVETRWEGPAGRSDNPGIYVVPTGDLRPGTYAIHYHVRDTQGLVAEAQAELHIVEAFRQLSADIFPKTLNVTQGQSAQFHASYLADPRLDTKSLWDGPAGESGNPDTYIVPTHDLAPGTYTIHYQIHDSQGRKAEVESVLHVTAEEAGAGDGGEGPLDGMLIWVLGGGGGLLVGLGFGWWLRLKVPKLKDRKQKLKSPTAKLTVKLDPKYELWRGGFEKIPDAGNRVHLALVADLGDQMWGDMSNTSPEERGTDHD